MSTDQSPRGFTLVELMMVVAIVGILSSVAMPSFRNLQLRTRQSERHVITRVVKQSVEDFYVRYGQMEDGSGTAMPVVVGAQNPPGVPSPSRRAYDPTAANWSLLGVTEQFLEGSLYYAYTFWVTDVPGNRRLIILAQGDLDGDLDLSTKWFKYVRDGNVYQLESTWPPEGAPDQSEDSGKVTW